MLGGGHAEECGKCMGLVSVMSPHVNAQCRCTLYRISILVVEVRFNRLLLADAFVTRRVIVYYTNCKECVKK